VFPIRVPSLRERAEDIPLLVEYLIERYATKTGKRIRKINRSTLTLFQAYDWPGNIRELQNVIERAVILCDGDTFSVDETWLAHDRRHPRPEHCHRRLVGAATPHPVGNRTTSDRGCSGQNRWTCGRPKGAAAKLGIPRQTLDSKITALGIDKYQYKSR